MLICCGNALLPVVAAAETPAANLRYPGVYMLEDNCFDAQRDRPAFCNLRIIRFFPDKTVIAGELRGVKSDNSVPDSDETEPFETRDYPKPYHFDLADARYRGTYAAQGSTLKLRLANTEETLTLTATLQPERLALRSADAGEAAYQFLPIGPSAETAPLDKIVAEINRLPLQAVTLKFKTAAWGTDELGKAWTDCAASYHLTVKADASGRIRKVRFSGGSCGDMNVHWQGYVDPTGQLVMVNYQDCCFPEIEGQVYFQNGQPVQPVAFLLYVWGYEGENILWSRGFLDQQDEIGRRFQQDLDWLNTKIHPTLEGLFNEFASRVSEEQERLRRDLDRLIPTAPAEEKAQGEKLLNELNQAAVTLQQMWTPTHTGEITR